MLDYGDILDRIERGMGERFRQSRDILNIPGVSLACKVDMYHYLALRPGFATHAAKWAGTLPARAEEALIHTGNLVVGADRERFPEPFAVFEEGTDAVLRLYADLMQAAFIDRALSLYGGEAAPLPVSRLRIHASQRPRLDAFLEGKTKLQALAFGEPE